MSSQFIFDAIGTHWQIDIEDALETAEEKRLLEQIRNRIELFDKAYSRFRQDSLVTQMSRVAGVYQMPPDAKPMIELYRELYDVTGGLVTPLIGQVLVDAGYDANYSLKQKKQLAKPPAWEEVLEYDHPHLTLKEPALLDFGAAGKGYLVDIVSEVLEQHGAASYCVDAGGDLLQRSALEKPLRVGMENPKNFSQAIGVIELINKSLCASAGSRRKWGSFTHIINPKELSSPEKVMATWVIADTTMLADALATCLFFVEAKMLQKYNFEYLVLYPDYSVETSAYFPGELFKE